MKSNRVSTSKTLVIQVFLIVPFILGWISVGEGQQSLTISGTGQSISGAGAAQLGVTADFQIPVQGFVLAVGIDSSLLQVSDVSLEGTPSELLNPDFAVAEIFPDGFTLGVIYETEPPIEGLVLEPGNDVTLASYTLQSMVILEKGESLEASVDFVDFTLNDPPLQNILIQGGESVGNAEGLILNSAPTAVTLLPPPPASLSIENVNADDNFEGCARIMLDSPGGETQGFVLAIAHDESVLELMDIDLVGTDTATVAPDFVAISLESGGGTLGVIFDVEAPFEDKALPPGSGLHLSSFCYRLLDPLIITEGEPVPDPVDSDLVFTDGVFGNPPLSNVIVQGGLSISPELISGQFHADPVILPSENTILSIQTEFDLSQGDAPIPGAQGQLNVKYSDPDDNIQGFTLTVCYDCELTLDEESWTFEDSILEEVGVEYLAVQVDDDPQDGDGCELIVGILLDALPPFDGQTLPQPEDLLKVGSMTVEIDETAPCDGALTIEFCDGINGLGEVILDTNVVINFDSIRNFERQSTVVQVVPLELFQRGDCNSDDQVDLADVATLVSNLFFGFEILCPDACDMNDDSAQNLADAVFGLNFLFNFGGAPPLPGPYDDGPDPSEDSLPVCQSDDTAC